MINLTDPYTTFNIEIINQIFWYMLHGLMVRVVACNSVGPSSIPGMEIFTYDEFKFLPIMNS
jgi:hypothetical protein